MASVGCEWPSVDGATPSGQWMEQRCQMEEALGIAINVLEWPSYGVSVCDRERPSVDGIYINGLELISVQLWM